MGISIGASREQQLCFSQKSPHLGLRRPLLESCLYHVLSRGLAPLMVLNFRFLLHPRTSAHRAGMRVEHSVHVMEQNCHGLRV